MWVSPRCKSQLCFAKPPCQQGQHSALGAAWGLAQDRCVQGPRTCRTSACRQGGRDTLEPAGHRAASAQLPQDGEGAHSPLGAVGGGKPPSRRTPRAPSHPALFC